MDHLFNIFIEFVIVLLLFYVLGFFFFFGPETCGIVALQLGTKLAPCVLEGEVLTTGQPGKPLN